MCVCVCARARARARATIWVSRQDVLQCLSVMSGCVCNDVMQLLCCSVWVSW